MRSDRALVLVTRPKDEPFAVVQVGRNFGPRAYDAVLRALQEAPGPKVLDLAQATLISLDLFEQIASRWTSPRGTVPQLVIALSFSRWITCGPLAQRALEPLAARGVQVAVLYDAQVTPLRLRAWLEHRQLSHDVRGVIEAFAVDPSPSSRSPAVLQALAGLCRTHASAAELPALLYDVAQVARASGHTDLGELLTDDARCYLWSEHVSRWAFGELAVPRAAEGEGSDGARKA